MNLSKLLTAAMKQKDLSMLAGSKKLGVAYQSFCAVVKGKAMPNSRTVKKYAKFLGLPVEKITGDKPAPAAPKAKPVAKKVAKKGRR